MLLACPPCNAQPSKTRLRGSDAARTGLMLKLSGAMVVALARAAKSIDCAAPVGVGRTATVPAAAGGTTEPYLHDISNIRSTRHGRQRINLTNRVRVRFRSLAKPLFHGRGTHGAYYSSNSAYSLGGGIARCGRVPAHKTVPAPRNQCLMFI
jgi:hypothetical protein